jgi:hypothetical protein
MTVKSIEFNEGGAEWSGGLVVAQDSILAPHNRARIESWATGAFSSNSAPPSI